MRSRNARRALCLCVALLGLTAFNSSAAYGSGWMLEGSELKEGVLPSVFIRGHGTLLFGALGAHVKVLCTGTGTVGAHLVWGVPPVRLLGNLKYLNCTVRVVIGGKEEVLPACEPKAGGKEAGVIVSKELEGELTLVSKEGVILLKPKTGTTLETIEMGPECSLGEKIPIIGTLALKDTGGLTSLEKEAKIHTVEEGPGTEMWAISKTAEHKATLGGKFEMELESGKLWSGLAP